MGGHASKKRGNLSEKNVGGLREKVRSIQEEMSEMVCERNKESAAYERDMMVFAFKEAEWKQEKKKMREEVKTLRKVVEEKEERIRGMEDGGGGVVVVGGGGGGNNNKSSGGSGGENNSKEWEVLLGSGFLAEQMREERARRDETVEKWKQLYLAIKVELDDLIQRTHCANGLYWRAEEEDIVEEQKRELKAKEEMIASLKSKIASMEHEHFKKEREIDILRQSLRIMSCKKTLQAPKNVSRDSQLVKPKQARKL